MKQLTCPDSTFSAENAVEKPSNTRSFPACVPCANDERACRCPAGASMFPGILILSDAVSMTGFRGMHPRLFQRQFDNSCNPVNRLMYSAVGPGSKVLSPVHIYYLTGDERAPDEKEHRIHDIFGTSVCLQWNFILQLLEIVDSPAVRRKCQTGCDCVNLD